MARKKTAFILAFIILVSLTSHRALFAQDTKISSQKTSKESKLNAKTVDLSIDDKDKSTFSGGSISDLAIESLMGITQSGVRDPFSSGAVENEIDPSGVKIQGIIVGPEIKLGLVEKQIVTIDSRIGNYTVKDIKPGRILLKQLDDLFEVKMDGYSPSLIPRNLGKFFIEFNSADIRLALGMLAKASGVNLIIPEKTEGKVTVSFNNIDVKDVITSILHVNDLEYSYENNIMRIGSADQFKDGSDLKAISIPLKYATAEDLESKIKAFLSDRGKTVSDKRTNTIIVKDQANVISNVKDFLESIDTKDAQVAIEAKIIDATATFSRSLGIQWGLTSGPGNLIFKGNGDMGNITNGNTSGKVASFPAQNPTSGLDILIGRLPGNTTLQTQLSAAEAQGLIRIISKPNIITLNNKAANIRSGDTIYVKVNSGQGQSAGEPELKEIQTGIELSVTPQITLNRIIKMTIEANESSPDFSRLTDGIPAILENKATTTILVADGETTVIGGLLKATTTKDKRSVPGISKVPVLGWLFKGTSKTKDNKELMIFITPKILDAQNLSVAKTDASVNYSNTEEKVIENSVSE